MWPALVDYVGLSYNYTNWSSSSAGGPASEYNFEYIDVTGIIGIFGFVGMIGLPAVTVWAYRREGGGSKIGYAIFALIGFIICFGLFMGVLET